MGLSGPAESPRRAEQTWEIADDLWCSAYVGLLALMFIIVPVIELALLIELGGWIGLGPTLGLIILTGVIGASLAKQQGLSVLRRFQAETQAGRLPGDALIDGAIIVFSGALLLTPGIMTDAVGFLGLIPFARNWVKRSIRASVEKAVAQGNVRVQTYVVHRDSRYPDGDRANHPGPVFDRDRRPPGRFPGGGGPIIDVTPDQSPSGDGKTSSRTDPDSSS